MEEFNIDKPDFVPLKQIGDPEKVKNDENVKQGVESKRCIRKGRFQ